MHTTHAPICDENTVEEGHSGFYIIWEQMAKDFLRDFPLGQKHCQNTHVKLGKHTTCAFIYSVEYGVRVQ